MCACEWKRLGLEVLISRYIRNIDAHTSDLSDSSDPLDPSDSLDSSVSSDSLDPLDPSDSLASALLYASKMRLMPYGYSSTCYVRFVQGEIYTVSPFSQVKPDGPPPCHIPTNTSQTIPVYASTVRPSTWDVPLVTDRDSAPQSAQRALRVSYTSER